MNSIRALLAHAIDYAGLFPPAGLTMEDASRNYASYRHGPDSWALGRFVVPSDRAPEAGIDSDALSIVAGPVEKARNFSYFEMPPEILRVANEKGRAKIRTGGLDPDKFPATRDLADFIAECAKLRLAFKATAGLHHAVRGVYPLTYEIGSASTTMHGFLNLLIAACFAWHGGPVQPILEEQDVTNFRIVEDSVSWRHHSLSTSQIIDARANFMISFGSCSFEEPMQELRALGLL